MTNIESPILFSVSSDAFPEVNLMGGITITLKTKNKALKKLEFFQTVKK